MLAAASSLIASALAAISLPIIGGEPAPADAAVVALVVSTSVPYCSGTLVAPDRVLTAAHCLIDASGGVLMPTDVVLQRGAAEERLAVRWAVVAEGFDRPTLSHDLAVLGLAGPATLATPVQLLGRALVAADIGRDARWIGFGFDQPGPSGQLGVRHVAITPIAELTDARIVAAPVSCNGDSGGAVMVDEGAGPVLIGTVSAGGPSCTLYSKATRGDTLGPWVGTLPEPTCARDHGCVVGCATADPDCGCPADGVCGTCATGEVDPDCVAEGDVCRSSRDCADGLCVDGLCRQACDAMTCGDARTCVADVHYGAYCAPVAGGCTTAGHPATAGALLILITFGLRRPRRHGPRTIP